MEEKIKVLIVEPNELPYEKVIDNELKAKQDIVGGLIEYTTLGDDNSLLICNEEGKILGLPVNRDIGHDVIAGTFIIVGTNDSEYDLSLTDEQIEKYKERFNEESIEEVQNVSIDDFIL